MNSVPVTVHPDRETWLEAHRTFTGGSGIVNILGIPVDGREPHGLWWEWVRCNPNAWEAIGEAGRERYAEIDREIESKINVPMRQAAEPVIENWLAEQEGVTIWDPGDFCVIQSETDPRRGFSPDGLVLDPGVRVEPKRILSSPAVFTIVVAPAEYKTLRIFARKWWSPDEPNLYALIQSTWGASILGTDWALVGAQVDLGDAPGERMSYRVEVNQDLVGELALAHERFWRYVDHDEEPPVDGFERTMHAIRLLYPSVVKKRGTVVTLGPGVAWNDPERGDTALSLPAVQAEVERIKDQQEKMERRRKMLERAIELTAARADENVGEIVIPPLDPGGSEAVYHRSLVKKKPRVCKCGATIQKGSEYTRFKQDR